MRPEDYPAGRPQGSPGTPSQGSPDTPGHEAEDMPVDETPAAAANDGGGEVVLDLTLGVGRVLGGRALGRRFLGRRPLGRPARALTRSRRSQIATGIG